MRKIGFLFLLFTLFVMEPSRANITSFTNKADVFFKKYVKEGKVNYETVKRNFSEIEALYREIGAMKLSELSVDTKKSFYINAYNLIVIYQVSKYYPLKSALDQSGFFDQVRHKVAEESITLNELEIKKIILVYHDPRIHFALACAAVSCPQLASFAYYPDKLDQQLQQRTLKALNDPEFVLVDAPGKRVGISQIFKWYHKDFTTEGKSVLDFINQYRKLTISSSYQQYFYEYNWQLNEQ